MTDKLSKKEIQKALDEKVAQGTFVIDGERDGKPVYKLEPIRERQRMVCLRVIQAAGANGAILDDCNDALLEEGLPTIADDEEMAALMEPYEDRR